MPRKSKAKQAAALAEQQQKKTQQTNPPVPSATAATTLVAKQEMTTSLPSSSSLRTALPPADTPKKQLVRQLQSEGRAHAFLASDGGHRLIERVRRQLAISHDDAYIAVYNYLIFLLLKEEAEDWNADKLSPTAAIDQIWHLHILDTAHYGEDVRKLCPSLVEKDKTFHHNPDGVFDEDGGRKHRQETTLLMKAAREKREMSVEQEYWIFQEGERGNVEATITTAAAPSSSARENKLDRVFVKSLDGKVTIIDIFFSATVLELKSAIHDKRGAPIDSMRLIFDGKQLEDHRTLADYNIQHESTVDLVYRLRGC